MYATEYSIWFTVHVPGSVRTWNILPAPPTLQLYGNYSK